jgi:hypothetical protein
MKIMGGIMASKLRMSIDARVLYQMYEYAAFAKTIHGSEIAGYGHYREKDGIYKLAPLTNQIITGGAEVDTFPSTIINDVKYDISDMVVQWHSHVEMNTFFSGTDQKNIKDMLGLYPLLISIVVNVKQEYTARLDIRNVAYGNHIMRLPEDNIASFDVELVPYYSNDVVYNEVRNKLKQPHKKHIRTKITQLPVGNQQPANNNFGKEDDNWWDEGMWGNTLDEITASEEPSFKTASEWDEDVIMMAAALCLDHEQEFRFTKIEGTGTIFINHKPTHIFCTIEDGEIFVQGQLSDWSHFLVKCGGDYLDNYGITPSNKERVRQKLEEIVAKKVLTQGTPKSGV